MLIVNNFLWQNSEHFQDSNIVIILALQIPETVKKLLDRVSMCSNLKYKSRECKTDLCQKLSQQQQRTSSYQIIFNMNPSIRQLSVYIVPYLKKIINTQQNHKERKTMHLRWTSTKSFDCKKESV